MSDKHDSKNKASAKNSKSSADTKSNSSAIDKKVKTSAGDVQEELTPIRKSAGKAHTH